MKINLHFYLFDGLQLYFQLIFAAYLIPYSYLKPIINKAKILKNTQICHFVQTGFENGTCENYLPVINFS